MIIVGCGSLGQRVFFMLHEQVDAFYDDDPDKIGEVFQGVPIFGPVELVPPLDVVIAIGDLSTRKRLYKQLNCKGRRFANVMHPDAIIERGVYLAPNVIVKFGASIGANVIIGENTIVGTGDLIGHNLHVGKHCNLGPGLVTGGHVTIGDNCLIGVGVNIDRQLSIGENSIICSGCTIWKDVPPNSFVKLPNPMIIKEKIKNG